MIKDAFLGLFVFVLIFALVIALIFSDFSIDAYMVCVCIILGAWLLSIK
jgi:hypothetical protein